MIISHVQNNYGVDFYHLYEQFVKENETNLQLRNELKDRHTEFINIAVFLLAGEKGSTQNNSSKAASSDETKPTTQHVSQEKKPKYGSVNIKGMKADFKYAEPDKAIPIVKAATFIQPHDTDNWCILGNLYIEKKDWKSAVACFDKALAKNPKSSRAIEGKERALKWMG